MQKRQRRIWRLSSCAAVAALSVVGCAASPDDGGSGSSARATCVEVVKSSCGLAATCMSELPSFAQAAIPTEVKDAIESCDQTLDSLNNEIQSGCESFLASGSDLVTYLENTDVDTVLQCAAAPECSADRAVVMGDAIRALSSDPADPYPILSALLGTCAGGPADDPGKGDDPGPAPDPEPDPEPDPQPDPEPDPQPQPAASYTIQLVSGHVEDSKANGDGWDCCFFNTPDLKVVLTIAGDTFTSDTASGTDVEWNEELATGISDADLLSGGITVELVDDDPGNDDTAGTCSFEIDEQDLGAGPTSFDCARDETTDKAGWTVTLSFEPE